MLNLDRFGGDGRPATSDDGLEVDRGQAIRQFKAVISGQGPRCHSVVCQRAEPPLALLNGTSRSANLTVQ